MTVTLTACLISRRIPSKNTHRKAYTIAPALHRPFLISIGNNPQ
jgi:hypothetical protein